MEAHAPPPPSSPASCWSTIVKKTAPPPPPISCHVFGDCKSSKGITVAVVDASAIIHGDKLSGSADKFVSLKAVVEEVRDPVSRQRLVRLPFFVDTMEPSPEFIKKVVNFARATGDLQALSDVDLKLIALTYMLEAQIHGTDHLRVSPPQFHVVNVKTLPEAQLPGWGNNVPNLAEWEALDQTVGESMENSKILPLKDLDDNVISTTKVEPDSTEYQDDNHDASRHRKIKFPKRELKLEVSKIVAEGVDASNGENNDYDEWHLAVSRSTHRRFLKRKAKREAKSKPMFDENPIEDLNLQNIGDEVILKDNHVRTDSANYEDGASKKDVYSANDVSSAFEQMSLNIDDSEVALEGEDDALSNMGFEDDDRSSEKDILHAIDITAENENDICENLSENLEVSNIGDGNTNTSVFDDASSDQSWLMCSLSDSTVACITSDYAMQNVILQIGLRLLAPGGMQIRKLHRWVLKCHACNNVTQEMGKIFCSQCGNGGTLRKVSVTVGGNGILLASRRQRIILRGTKYSLPLPQGGRDAITKNLILREDQLPQKLLYPTTKKKPSTKDEDFLCTEDIFSNASDKRGPLKPPVRKAVALFSGKRNPNDNHFSRKHC